MCGRYLIITEEEVNEIRSILAELNRRAQESNLYAKVKTNGEVFPTDVVPVIVGTNEEYGVRPMRWGFPHWQTKKPIINARSETAFDKTMFKKPLLEHRVIIPTSGFYEWMHEGKKATGKFLFRRPDEDVLYLAGMYNYFSDEDGQKYEHFTILTTAANESMAPYHDRMPVLLDKGERSQWLRCGEKDIPDFLQRVSGELVAVPA